jgi:hypothetical protein
MSERYGGARQATVENITRRMRFASWLTKATNTRLEYVILIDFPMQQDLGKRALKSHYMYSLVTVLLLTLADMC